MTEIDMARQHGHNSEVADKLEKDNIKVYRVVNIIRIDVKEK